MIFAIGETLLAAFARLPVGTCETGRITAEAHILEHRKNGTPTEAYRFGHPNKAGRLSACPTFDGTACALSVN